MSGRCLREALISREHWLKTVEKHIYGDENLVWPGNILSAVIYGSLYSEKVLKPNLLKISVARPA